MYKELHYSVMFTLSSIFYSFYKIIQMQIHSLVVDPKLQLKIQTKKSNVTELMKTVTPSCCICTSGKIKQ